jgi:hypothetical protein
MKACPQAGSTLYASKEESVPSEIRMDVTTKEEALLELSNQRFQHAKLGGPIDSGSSKPYPSQA